MRFFFLLHVFDIFHSVLTNYKMILLLSIQFHGFRGDVTIPLAGMIEPLVVSIDFTSVTDAIVNLATNQWHDVAVYVANQYFRTEARIEEMESTRFEMSIRPIEINHGTIATASSADASGTFSVCRYAVFKNNNKVVDIDQFNQIHVVNGVDCAAAVRQAIGMM